MKNLPTTICRVYLLLLSLYHVLTGMISFFFPNFAIGFYKKMYGCEAEHREQLMINLRPWGALAICAGIAGLFSASDPMRYGGVVVALSVLLGLRVLYRIVLREKLARYGGMTPKRNIISISTIIIGEAILIGWLLSLL